MNARILIVDDDAGIREVIASFLGRHGFTVDATGDPAGMRKKLAESDYALIVLDLMMPGEDGLTALKALQRSGGPPVIMLSAVDSDIDRIVGLEIGAEDYLAKPCNPRELLARIRTVLRRRSPAREADGVSQTAAAPANGGEIASRGEGHWLHFAGWRIDLMSRLLYNPANALVTLSDGEFRLLRTFAQHPRRVLTRDQLLDLSAGPQSDTFDRAVDVQISRLRRKLSFGAERPDLIRTVRNEGYLFVPSVTRGES